MRVMEIPVSQTMPLWTMVMAKNVNPKLYKVVKGGDIAFIQERARDMESSLLLETSPKSNTILHAAASFGHDKLVQAILKIQRCQQLVVARTPPATLLCM